MALEKRLANHPIGAHLLGAGLLAAKACASLEKELSEKDPALEGRCPLDSVRLRSLDAVEAYGMWLYILVRTMRPKAVVETGVQNGCSTELILWALHRNRWGQLYSIDSGPTSSDGSHATQWNKTTDGVPGKDILDGLKGRWDLTVGLSRECLPGLCNRLKKVDIFWHDSDHSSGNVKVEFETAMPFVPPGGVVCLHDYDGQDIQPENEGFERIVHEKAPLLRAWRRA